MTKYSPLIIVFFLLASCGPSAEGISNTQTSIVSTVYAELTANGPTATPLSTITPTPTFTPSFTSTPRPTITPTPTPIPGAFNNPVQIGNTSILWDAIVKSSKMSLTLIDTQRGDAANQLARQNLDVYDYKDPIADQEYLGVNIRIEYLESLDRQNEVLSLYPYWHLTLRYSPDGSDIWSLGFSDNLVEGYLPLSKECWVFFLIRKDTMPLLYFQPNLMASEPYGYRTEGVFFNLLKP